MSARIVCRGARDWGRALPVAALLAVAVASFPGLPAAANAADGQALRRLRAVYAERVASAPPEQRSAAYRLIVDVAERIARSYVRPIPFSELVEGAEAAIRRAAARMRRNPEALASAAVEAMVGRLDPWSRFAPRPRLRFAGDRRPRIAGIGAEIAMLDGRLVVVAPLDGGPARAAGLRAGDVIAAIDGKSVQGLAPDDAFARLRGPVGKAVRLTVRRGAGPAVELSVVRRRVARAAVRHRIEREVGYIRVPGFAPRTERAVRQALVAIARALAGRLRGYVLDLRDNAGGLVGQAVLVADAFLENGEIVSTQGRDPRDRRTYRASAGDLARGRPLVVLINRGSASAAEILAGALKDNRRALVVGRRSFGKGVVQTRFGMGRWGVLRLTTHRYFTASGRAIDGNGIVPDVAILADGTSLTAAGSAVREGDCPPAGPEKDRMLGCAVALVEAGGLAPFLAAFGREKRTVPGNPRRRR